MIDRSYSVVHGKGKHMGKHVSVHYFVCLWLLKVQNFADTGTAFHYLYFPNYKYETWVILILGSV